MKRFTLILLAVLSAIACRKVTPEEQIAQIAGYFEKTSDAFSENLQRHEGDKRVDYLTLTLAKELMADDLWTLEYAGEKSLIAEFPGREKKQTQFSLLSASLDDPEACAVVLNTLQAFKDLKIKPKGTIRTLFYNPVQDTLGFSGLTAVFGEFYESGELVTFELEVSSRDSIPPHTFRIEEKPAFADQLIEVIPPYLAPLGNFQFVRGQYPNKEWPVKASVYRYRIDPADLRKESAAVAAFCFLVN
ncbi:MAG: hypothetical protein IKX53_10065 [Bacteroidales bacterium]|nr:hypothetical protein [Bacteroidales bacterium]